jgi:hypothetical protein
MVAQELEEAAAGDSNAGFAVKVYVYECKLQIVLQ